jgi:DNA-binding NtrC family response regulator
MFNKALYYSLNTVPVRMPALRERSKDIPSLAKTYMDQCNEKYKSKKILSNNALGVLESHTWPGNLIELNQAIESAYILTDGPMISGKTLYEIIYDSAPEDNTAKVICTDIIPLKEAKRQVEEQLVKNAMEVYKTTYRAAEVLEVNQSTVSRIVAKLFK